MADEAPPSSADSTTVEGQNTPAENVNVENETPATEPVESEPTQPAEDPDPEPEEQPPPAEDAPAQDESAEEPAQAGNDEADDEPIGTGSKRNFVGKLVPVNNQTSDPNVDPDEQYVKRVNNSLQPGDHGYDANSDPLVNTSTTAETIMTEIKGFGHSPMWKAIREDFEKAYSRFFGGDDDKNA